MDPANRCCVDKLTRPLDDKTRALVRLGALMATGAGAECFRRHVTDAWEAGATDEEVVDALLAVAPTIGMAALVSSTTCIALGLGYDVNLALEELDER